MMWWIVVAAIGMLVCPFILAAWANATALNKDFNDWYDQQIEKGKVRVASWRRG